MTKPNSNHREVTDVYFAWKEEYSVNIEAIDNQHKKLFEIGRKVSHLIFSNDTLVNNEDIVNIFNELKKYTEFHFRFEEKLLQENGYAHYVTHKYEHDLLIEKIKKIESNNSGSLQKEILMELINFVFEWISNHIVKGDMKYKDFLGKNI